MKRSSLRALSIAHRSSCCSAIVAASLGFTCISGGIGLPSSPSRSASSSTTVSALKIAVITGTTRTSPPPRPILGPRVSSYICQTLEDRGHSVSIIDPREVQLPLLEKPHFAFAQSQIPTQLAELHDILVEADAYVTITPEYNHAPSPALLNILNHFGSSVFSWKPSAIVSYSAGQWGGSRAAIALRPVLSELGCLPVSALVHIPNAGGVFDEDGNVIGNEDEEEKWRSYVGRCVAQLEWWGEAALAHRSLVDPNSPYLWSGSAGACLGIITVVATMNFTNSPVAKRFDGEIFKGQITSYFPPDPDDAGDDQELWHVKYDDGDEEDLDREEVEEAIKLHECLVDQKNKPKRKMPFFRKGQKIRKHFRGHGTFTGEISEEATESYPYCFVTYRDGDSEHIHVKDIHRYVSADGTTSSEHVVDNSVPMKCIMCEAHGRKPSPLLDTAEQLLPVQLKPQGVGGQKIVVAYIHSCCALRAPPSAPLSNPEENMPAWWEEVVEKSHGYEGLPEDRFDSTSDSFVPFSMTSADWLDDFALYNYRMLLASVRRFDEGRGPPYNSVESRAALWRCDDRGSIAFCRMAPSLVARTKDEIKLASAEGALWGAILYRVFNRLSTFSRWAAVKTVAAKLDLSLSATLKRSKSTGTSAYEMACHGPSKDRKDEFHSIAASGVTLYGRHGYRDRWGKQFCAQQMRKDVAPMCCVAELPMPNELSDFKTFVEWEVSHHRGVMTAEHQVQSKSKIFVMLQKLATNNCAQLRTLGNVLKNSSGAQPVLDELRKLDTVGDFFAWQIFSDLVSVQRHCQLFAKDEILPSPVVEDSFSTFALFGPGARKGAYILDGGAAEVCEFDQDVPQAATLHRSRRILEEFPEALRRIKLDGKWKVRAHGRQFDLETLEHSLCGYYCGFHNLVKSAIALDDDTSNLLEKIAQENGCTWSRRHKRAPSKPANSPDRYSRGSWHPNPCTAMERTDLKEMVKAVRNKIITNLSCKNEEKL